MIEYIFDGWEKLGDRDCPVKVRLDGKICGNIKVVDGGWQYFPKGRKEGGDIFPTLAEVQKSLESE